MLSRWLLALITSLLLAGPTLGNNPPPAGKRFDPSGLLPLLSSGSTDALAGAIRGQLVQSLPNPLYEANPGWGTTKPGIMRKGHARKDGRWRHIRVSAQNPANTLIFDIRDIQHPEPGRITFTVFLSFDARVEYEKQHWESGIKLADNKVRARLRVKVNLACEATARLEAGGLLLPDAIFRLHVLHSNVDYDNFVTEHIAGVGGEAAKLLGDSVKSGIRQWHPSLERDMLARVNAAIEKSADTKEVRLSLFDLLKKKPASGGAAPPSGLNRASKP